MSGDLDLQQMATAAIKAWHLRVDDHDSMTTIVVRQMLVEFGHQVQSRTRQEREQELHRQLDCTEYGDDCGDTCLKHVREAYDNLRVDFTYTWKQRAEAAEARLSTLVAQVQGLTQKLTAMLADPSYLSIVALAAIHGFTYTGPNFKTELDAVCAEIAKEQP